nr:immunoglobulin heavy chain junction region [Mus musculus]
CARDDGNYNYYALDYW